MENWRDVKVYTIHDFWIWHERGELSLSPKYQRNPVWKKEAKSYLIDTILRGLTVPPIFLRQQTNFALQKIEREIIDGQQRLRTIFEFRNNEFTISKIHNQEYGNLFFDDLPNEAQDHFLNFSLATEIIRTTDDSLVYDIFARLNSNNIMLNAQEKRNAKYHGAFKTLAYQLAKESKSLFQEWKLFKEHDFTRMIDVVWVSKILIFLIYPTKTQVLEKQIDNFYQKYDLQWDNMESVEQEYKHFIGLLNQFFETRTEVLKPFTYHFELFYAFLVALKTTERTIEKSHLSVLSNYIVENIFVFPKRNAQLSEKINSFKQLFQQVL